MYFLQNVHSDNVDVRGIFISFCLSGRIFHLINKVKDSSRSSIFESLINAF